MTDLVAAAPGIVRRGLAAAARGPVVVVRPVHRPRFQGAGAGNAQTKAHHSDSGEYQRLHGSSPVSLSGGMPGFDTANLAVPRRFGQFRFFTATCLARMSDSDGKGSIGVTFLQRFS